MRLDLRMRVLTVLSLLLLIVTSAGAAPTKNPTQKGNPHGAPITAQIDDNGCLRSWVVLDQDPVPYLGDVRFGLYSAGMSSYIQNWSYHWTLYKSDGYIWTVIDSGSQLTEDLYSSQVEDGFVVSVPTNGSEYKIIISFSALVHPDYNQTRYCTINSSFQRQLGWTTGGGGGW